MDSTSGGAFASSWAEEQIWGWALLGLGGSILGVA